VSPASSIRAQNNRRPFGGMERGNKRFEKKVGEGKEKKEEEKKQKVSEQFHSLGVSGSLRGLEAPGLPNKERSGPGKASCYIPVLKMSLNDNLMVEGGRNFVGPKI